MIKDSHQSSGRCIFCCSGASNAGALSYLAAIRLAKEGSGSFSCIAGIGSSNQPMIRAAKSARECVLIDGCPIGCGKKIMDKNRVPIDQYVIVTDRGIDKTHGLDIEECDVETVVENVRGL